MNKFEGAPVSIRVGAHDYEIEVMPPEWARSKDEVTAFGEYSEFEQKIRVRSDVKTASMAREILLHEIVHVFLNPLCIKAREEEVLAQVIGLGLVSMFKDNPDLIVWLMEKKINECSCNGSCQCGPSTNPSIAERA